MSGIHRDEKKAIEAANRIGDQSQKLFEDIREFLGSQKPDVMVVVHAIARLNAFHERMFPDEYEHAQKMVAILLARAKDLEFTELDMLGFIHPREPKLITT